jgi:lipopolysaccharide/colanic/teichoic acid biosynthesis glycosyltransferase
VPIRHAREEEAMSAVTRTGVVGGPEWPLPAPGSPVPPSPTDASPVPAPTRAAAGSAARRVKRVLDVAGALAGLLLLSPLLLVAALAVRIESGPGVIFRQQRVGQGGRLFTMYKLRSLTPVADEGDVRWSVAGDARIGRVGRLIRKTSVDELPQLWNVVKGEMSLVGPRPERPYFVERFNATVPGYGMRHRVPVGLTGLAGVRGLRGDTSIEERARWDNAYADTWSLWLDLKILLLTARQLLSGA